MKSVLSVIGYKEAAYKHQYLSVSINWNKSDKSHFKTQNSLKQLKEGSF